MFLAKKKKRASAASASALLHTHPFFTTASTVYWKVIGNRRSFYENIFSLWLLLLFLEVSIKKQRNNRKPIWKVNDELCCCEWSGCIIAKCLFLHFESGLRNDEAPPFILLVLPACPNGQYWFCRRQWCNIAQCRIVKLVFDNSDIKNIDLNAKNVNGLTANMLYLFWNSIKS